MYLLHAVADSGRTVILTTHDIALATQADRILLLGPEGFVADGKPSEVLEDEAAWQRLGLRIPPWLKDKPSNEGRR
jgi:ABC-type cobalamin/Fe3+-siderophores transport system ATPase subunit